MTSDSDHVEHYDYGAAEMVSLNHRTKTESLVVERHGGTMSEWEAGISLAKAIMGAGSFALPWAFLQTGYLAGPILLCVIMFLSVHSLQLLVTCARASGKHSYVDVSRSVFGSTGATLAYSASVSASLGVCGSYLVFIAANVQSLLSSSDDGADVEQEGAISQTHIILCIVPLVVLLSSIRDMNHFAMASLLGNISVILGMVVVLVYGFWNYDAENTEQPKDLVAIASIETMPLAFGSIGYLFLVHFLSLPIESAMAQPEHFGSVASKTFAACAIASGSFGVLGYLLFANETQQIVLLNVHGSYFVSTIKLLLCLDLLLTYPVVMRPTIQIVESSLFKTKKRTHDLGLMQHLLVCLLLGVVAAAGGILVPAFGLLSSLVGGVSQTFLAFVMPPLMLTKQRFMARRGRGEDDVSMTTLLLYKEVGLVGLGGVLIVWTLISTWQELMIDA